MMETTAMGNYASMIRDLASRCSYPYSYLSDRWNDVEAWQKAARAEIHDLLGYRPEQTPMDPMVHGKHRDDGLIYERISYAQPFGPRTEGVFVYPEKRDGQKLPAVLALHDHGGFKYFGKEKIVELPGEHPCLQAYRNDLYGGRAWVNELARRGYAVFVPDIFLWGSRKMTVDSLPPQMTGGIMAATAEGYGEHGPHADMAYIRAYNELAAEYESVVAKSLFLTGATWTGVMAYEDRRALNYLAGRPEVDAERIGCGGLSCGGLRTIYLTALDDRIRCSVCAGYMTTLYEEAVYMAYQNTWMFHMPGLARLMDLPDVYSLRGKKPAMLQFDIDDFLWTIKGQRDADEKMRRIYEKMGAPELYSGRFYEGTHKFDIPMQEDAFAFYDAWLKTKTTSA